MEKHTLNLYYSVTNGGDGSAYPHFSLNEKLVDIHQEIHNELQGEGWGESCTGVITLESDSPITIANRDKNYLITKESLLKGLDYYLEGGYYKKESVMKQAQEFKQQIETIEE